MSGSLPYIFEIIHRSHINKNCALNPYSLNGILEEFGNMHLQYLKVNNCQLIINISWADSPINYNTWKLPCKSTFSIYWIPVQLRRSLPKSIYTHWYHRLNWKTWQKSNTSCYVNPARRPFVCTDLLRIGCTLWCALKCAFTFTLFTCMEASYLPVTRARSVHRLIKSTPWWMFIEYCCS